MIDPRQTAEALLGPIEWETEASGFCKCPGEALHTHVNGKKDCRVSVDGAPTIFCFHASCAAAVAEANRRLRRELGSGEWAIALPGGGVLRSGDVLGKDGAVVERGAAGGRQRAEGRGQRSEGRGQRAEGRSQRSEGRGQRKGWCWRV